MFTGLVEEVGTVTRLHRRGEYQELRIEARKVLEDLEKGDSIAINGVCQTAVKIDESSFTVETLAVSLRKTSLGSVKKGQRVNLERAVRADSRLGGHIVQGHVDGTARVSSVRRRGENIFFQILLPAGSETFCVAGASIAIDGVSLTIAELRGQRLTVNIIPTTWKDTVLNEHRPGDLVNIEIDIMARYAAHLLSTYKSDTVQGENHG